MNTPLPEQKTEWRSSPTNYLTESELNRYESDAKVGYCPSVCHAMLRLIKEIRRYRCEAGHFAKGDKSEQETQRTVIDRNGDRVSFVPETTTRSTARSDGAEARFTKLHGAAMRVSMYMNGRYDPHVDTEESAIFRNLRDVLSALDHRPTARSDGGA